MHPDLLLANIILTTKDIGWYFVESKLWRKSKRTRAQIVVESKPKRLTINYKDTQYMVVSEVGNPWYKERMSKSWRHRDLIMLVVQKHAVKYDRNQKSHSERCFTETELSIKQWEDVIRIFWQRFSDTRPTT